MFEANYLPRLVETIKEESSREQSVLIRMKDALNDERYTWRKIETLAFKGGVTVGEALDILRRVPDVVLGKGESGNQMAKFQNR